MINYAKRKKLIRQIKSELPTGSAVKEQAAKLGKLTRYELEQIQNLQQANSRSVVLDATYAVELSEAAYDMIQELGIEVPQVQERVQPISRTPETITPGVTIDASYAVELTEETYDFWSAATNIKNDSPKTERKDDRGLSARTWFGRLFKRRRRGASASDLP